MMKPYCSGYPFCCSNQQHSANHHKKIGAERRTTQTDTHYTCFTKKSKIYFKSAKSPAFFKTIRFFFRSAKPVQLLMFLPVLRYIPALHSGDAAATGARYF